jgi:hypothetical protein
MNGVMPHENPMEDIQECVTSRQREGNILLRQEMYYSFKVPP